MTNSTYLGLTPGKRHEWIEQSFSRGKFAGTIARIRKPIGYIPSKRHVTIADMGAMRPAPTPTDHERGVSVARRLMRMLGL